jgi:hypothetical protein
MKNKTVIILFFTALVLGCSFSRGRGKNVPGGSQRVSNRVDRMQEQQRQNQNSENVNATPSPK